MLKWGVNNPPHDLGGDGGADCLSYDVLCETNFWVEGLSDSTAELFAMGGLDARFTTVLAQTAAWCIGRNGSTTVFKDLSVTIRHAATLLWKRTLQLADETTLVLRRAHARFWQAAFSTVSVLAISSPINCHYRRIASISHRIIRLALQRMGSG